MSKISVEKKIDIIILEDNPLDVEILMSELHKAEIQGSWTVVSTKEEYLKKLDSQYDIILADYTLPNFNASQALALLQERALDIPFIVISSMVGEDTAVAIMRAGATDFLLKDRLYRLGKAIENALQLKRLRRQSVSTAETLKKMMRAVEQSADSIVITDSNGVIEYVNPGFSKITGYSEEDVIGKTPAVLKSGKHDEKFYSALWNTIKDGRVFRAEFVNRKKNGELYTEVQAISPVFDDRGSIINFVSTGKDITERKHAEETIRHSEQQYRTLIEAMNEGVLQVDNSDVIIFVNNQYCKMIGYAREELIGSVAHEMLLLEEDRNFIRMKNLARTEGVADSYEIRMRTKAGDIRWFKISGAPIYDSSGSVIGSIGIHSDITEQKKTIEALKLFRTLIDGTNDAVEVIDPVTGRFLDINERECIDLGYSREEMLKMSVFDVDPNVRRENFEKETAAEREAGTTVTESVHKRKDGSVFPVEVTINYIQLDKEYIVAIVRDITERKQIERRNELIANLGYKLSSVETSEQAAKIVVDVADQLFGWDACTVDLYFENTGLVTTVLNVDTVQGERVVIPPSFISSRPTDRMKRILKEGALLLLRDTKEGFGSDAIAFGDTARPSASLMFVPIRTGDRAIGILSIQSYSPNKYNQSDIIVLQGMADQCGAAFVRIQTLEALKQSEERYRSLIDGAVDAIFTVTKEGLFTSLNPAFERITGWKRNEWLGKSFTDLIHEEDRKEIVANFKLRMQGKEVPVHEYRIITSSHTVVVIELLTALQYTNGEVVGMLGVARDVTERKKLEDQIRQAQKMESIGTLAGGIAHDFNNILGIILASATLLERFDPSHKNFKSTLETINRTVQRGAMLVRQILTFARRNEVTITSVQINDIVVELTKMLEMTIPKTIGIKLNLDASLPNINVDSNQVHQALLNLCVNARDAILDRRSEGMQSGTITITTTKVGRIQLKEQFQHHSAEHYIVLSVSDTGIGMDEETKRRIFDPFFTTKEIGKGTGLGLAVVYGVMQSQQGFVDVESVLGKGTTFSLYFPISDTSQTENRPLPERHTESQGGSETILVIEDEESLSELVKFMLEAKGYSVLTAANGVKGVEIFKEQADKISLVFTDFGLPEMDGFTMLQRIKEIKPDTHMLMASGYLESSQRSEIFQLGVYEIIQKPYEPSMILSKIREILDQRNNR